MSPLPQRRRALGVPSPAEVRAVVSTLYRRYGKTMLTRRSPFRVLISTVLSHRTKDEVTHGASKRLFARFPDAPALARADPKEVAALIRPVGFYNQKSRAVVRISEELLLRFQGKVPADLEGLTTLPSVGRKTANVVLVNGFGTPAVAVDTHVHRISNRMGWVATKHPDETEIALRKLAPRDSWLHLNDALVNHGRQICKPIGPRCSVCPVLPLCRRVGVRPARGFEPPPRAGGGR
jgi:endonuclease III